MSDSAALELLRGPLGRLVTVLDVGVRRGIDARWLRAGSLLDVIGIDPDEAECRRLQEASAGWPFRARYLPYALGAPGEREAVLHITRNPGSTSIYQPNREFVADFRYASEMAVVATAPVKLTTLDDVCRHHAIAPDHLKIDTQGYELNVLKGGESALRSVKLLELEVEFNPQYQEQPLFGEVDAHLRQHGFVLLGLRRSFWRRDSAGLPTSNGGQVMHGDVLYYSSRVASRGGGASAPEVLALCLLLSVYRQDDFLSHLLLAPHPALDGVPEAQRLAIAKAFVTRPPLASRVLGRLVALLWRYGPVALDHVTMRRAVDSLRQAGGSDWHDPDFF